MDQVRRYGPLALLAALVVGAGGVAILGGGETQDDAGGGRQTSDATADADLFPEGGGAPGPSGRMPVTFDEASAAGDVAAFDWGERCDPATGRVRIPSVYAAPCVPVFEGDNGGATSPGVTADTIRVVRYVAPGGTGLDALVSGVPDETAEQQARTFRDYVDLYSSRAELYGRRIELVDHQGTGAADDVVAARADATEIAAELEPFLVIGGPQLDRGTFAAELAANGVVCVDCAGALTGDMLDDLAPHIWGTLPSGDQFFTALTAWSAALADSLAAEGDGDGDGEALAGFAGEGLRDRPRRIGAIHFDQDPPVFAVPDDQVPEGIELIEGYVLDPATLPQKAAELVARCKAEGITTVVFLGDPLMPIYLTSAATEQDWYPEWIFTGTAFTDTNVFARQYDPAQMAHAFGISQLAAPLVQDLQEPVRLLRWWTGDPEALPAARATYSALHFTARFVVHGVHMAGPDLTPDTFARGQFRIPPAGGGPTTPQVSYGDWGFFPSLAGPDFHGIDDAAELWWDPSVAAVDEAGDPGAGVWRRSHGGNRFITEAPTPRPFDRDDDTVTVLEELPPVDVPPDYPPPGPPSGRPLSPPPTRGAR